MASSARGEGLGETPLRWAIDEARSKGCALVQLTSDNQRTDAHRFYQRLGFTPTHGGVILRDQALSTSVPAVRSFRFKQ